MSEHYDETAHMSHLSNIDRQFGFVNDLFIGLASGLLTYLFHISLTVSSSSATWLERGLYVLVVALSLLSLLSGASLAWRRVEHFRKLARHGRLSEADKQTNMHYILVSEKLNRRLLKWQGVCFALSLLVLSVLTVKGFVFG